ncbi:MAG: POTRA domain-containing protein, partial [Polyangia bacterium]
MIKHLDLEGTKQVSNRDIKKRIATAATGWWWPFATKQYFDPVTWQSDLRRIERVYETRGFYQAEVVSDEVKRVKGGVELTAVISEGKPTTVESFEVQGLEPLTPAERQTALDDLGIERGKTFLEGGWESAKEQLQARLRDMGFAEVELDARALVDVKTRKASLVMVVRPGERYRFGAIEVQLGRHATVAP